MESIAQAGTIALEPQDPRFLPARFGRRAVEVDRRSDGTIILRSQVPVSTRHNNYAAYVRAGALEHPDRVFLAERGPDGAWVHLTYASAWRRIAAVGAALAARGLGPDRPVAMMMANSIDAATVLFGAMAAGVPVAPLSPGYARIDGGMARLADMADVLRPAMLVVDDVAACARVRDIPGYAVPEWVSVRRDPRATPLDDLLDTPAGSAFDAAFAAVRPAWTAKVMFTAGSTGRPKGVMNTHGALGNALESTRLLFVPAEDGDADPFVMLDWLPWNHSLGGTGNIATVLGQRGSLYIDRGRPVPGDFATTVENLRDVRPSMMQNVPTAFQMLAEAMERDDDLRLRFFSRLRFLSYTGASLPGETWERIQSLAVRTTGRKVAFLSALGATEAGPGITSVHWFSDGAGQVGLPMPGFEMKLVPYGDRYEALVRGAALATGYLRDPEASARAFDADGYYRTGDALTLLDPADPTAGLVYAGRTTENFKLTNGSFVTVGSLRMTLLSAAHPFLREIVIAGEGRDDIRLLAWPDPSACRKIGVAGDGASLARSPVLAARIRQALIAHNAANPGATQRVAAFHLLAEPPSLGDGETTDKGNINQRGVLQRRAALVDRLYGVGSQLDVHPLLK